MSFALGLRRLWRRRIFLLPVLICACAVGAVIPQQHDVGVGSASALVDSTKSQVADLSADTGSDVGTLAARASLLASLMASSPIKDDIAARAGIPVSRLVASPPSAVAPGSSPAPDVSNSSVSASDPRANVLTISVPTVQAGQLPIIQVSTQAPTASGAARLATAAFAALAADVKSTAGLDRVPAGQRLVVRQLGPAGSAVQSQGPGLLYGLLGAIGTFALGCGAILGLSALGAAWRRESELELAMMGLTALPQPNLSAVDELEASSPYPAPGDSYGSLVDAEHLGPDGDALDPQPLTNRHSLETERRAPWERDMPAASAVSRLTGHHRIRKWS